MTTLNFTSESEGSSESDRCSSHGNYRWAQTPVLRLLCSCTTKALLASSYSTTLVLCKYAASSRHFFIPEETSGYIWTFIRYPASFTRHASLLLLQTNNDAGERPARMVTTRLSPNQRNQTVKLFGMIGILHGRSSSAAFYFRSNSTFWFLVLANRARVVVYICHHFLQSYIIHVEKKSNYRVGQFVKEARKS